MKDEVLKQAGARNSLIYNDIYMRLRQLALSVFEWNGLPDTCDARYLEKTLFDFGKAIFVHDKSKGYLNTKVNSTGVFNLYDIPTRLHAYGINYNEDYNYGDPDNVYIRNNLEEYPTQQTIRLYAYDLYLNKRTIDTNLHAQRTPILILTDEKQKQTMVNVYNQYDGFIPFIFGDKTGLNVDGVKVLKTDAPYLVDKLDRHKMIIWNEILSFLGINNTNTEKRERMTDNEVESNNDYIQMSSFTMLKTREQAAEEINKKFNLSVSVRKKTFEEIFNSEKEDGENNE